MPVQIGAPPDSGFDNPLGMLVDCHRRIEHFLHILSTVAERLGTDALANEETSAIEAALNYFRTGGIRHNADEEESLFPRLRADGEAVDLDSLESDHRIAGELHQEADALYRKWIAAGSLDISEHLRLTAITNRLQRIYREHIRLEEEVVFPLAARTLSPQELAAMGNEFERRRAE
jgi:hemerythrin-like domain-containing protein